MVSELRSRKLKSTDGRSQNSEGERSNADPDDQRDQSGGLASRLLEWDRAATLKCSICASSDSGPTLGFLRYFFRFLEFSGHGVPWIVIPVALMCYSDDQWLLEFLLNLLAGIFLDLLVNVILKAAVRRQRPAVNQNDMLLNVSVDKYSFPSGHCTRVGMLAFIFVGNLNLTVIQTVLYFLWTVGIAASRLCLGRHYITDITCGIVIGLLQGIFIQYYWMPIENLDYLKTYLN